MAYDTGREMSLADVLLPVQRTLQERAKDFIEHEQFGDRFAIGHEGLKFGDGDIAENGARLVASSVGQSGTLAPEVDKVSPQDIASIGVPQGLESQEVFFDNRFVHLGRDTEGKAWQNPDQALTGGGLGQQITFTIRVPEGTITDLATLELYVNFSCTWTNNPAGSGSTFVGGVTFGESGGWLNQFINTIGVQAQGKQFYTLSSYLPQVFQLHPKLRTHYVFPQNADMNGQGLWDPTTSCGGRDSNGDDQLAYWRAQGPLTTGASAVQNLTAEVWVPLRLPFMTRPSYLVTNQTIMLQLTLSSAFTNLQFQVQRANQTPIYTDSYIATLTSYNSIRLGVQSFAQPNVPAYIPEKQIVADITIYPITTTDSPSALAGAAMGPTRVNISNSLQIPHLMCLWWEMTTSANPRVLYWPAIITSYWLNDYEYGRDIFQQVFPVGNAPAQANTSHRYLQLLMRAIERAKGQEHAMQGHMVGTRRARLGNVRPTDCPTWELTALNMAGGRHAALPAALYPSSCGNVAATKDIGSLCTLSDLALEPQQIQGMIDGTSPGVNAIGKLDVTYVTPPGYSTLPFFTQFDYSWSLPFATVDLTNAKLYAAAITYRYYAINEAGEFLAQPLASFSSNISRM